MTGQLLTNGVFKVECRLELLRRLILRITTIARPDKVIFHAIALLTFVAGFL